MKNFKAVLFFIFAAVIAGRVDANGIHADDCVCPQDRSDNIPVCSVNECDDEYMTGYVQALVDMHYYEFQVQIVVQDRIAYVSCLPNNMLISHSILCFINDVPGIEGVEVCDNSDENICSECGKPICREGCSLFPGSPFCNVNGIWFPQNTVLFAPLIADPRQVINSASIRFNDNVISKHVGAVSFGDDFGIYRWKNVGYFCGDLELDIEAGIFSVFNLDDMDASLVNTDFFVALMFAYAYDAWSWRFRLWHLSSHLGDEFLLAHPGFDRRNLSDEGVDLFASYQLSPYVRVYAGIGDIFARDRSFPEYPLYFEFGSEIRVFGCRDVCNKLYIQPFFAMHFRSWQEHDYDFDQTYALGIEWSKIQGVGRRIRLFAEYHNGYSKEGQFVKERTNYSAIKLEYGF